MREERVQEILQMLEQTPTQPLRILIPNEADEVMYYVIQKYRSAHRVELHNGIHYITVTDEAVAVILDRLRRERADFQRTLEKYDEDIRGVEYLIENPQKRHYWSRSSYIVPPAYSEQ